MRRLGSNRGLAILGDKVFMVTDDAHMLALNRTTGKPVWEVVMPEKPMHYGGNRCSAGREGHGDWWSRRR